MHGMMQRVLRTATLVGLLFGAASCAPPAPPPTPTRIPATATAASTPTPTVPMIDVGGVQVPDPKVTNPEFFDLANAESPIVQFANAFEVPPQEVGELQAMLKTSTDGRHLVVMAVRDLAATPDFDESGTPLLVAEAAGDGTWTWTDALGKVLFRANGIDGGTYFSGYQLQDPEWQKITGQQFTLATMSYGIHWNESEPAQGKFSYRIAAQQIELAKGNGMIARGMGLVFPPLYPDWLKNYQGSPDELKQVLRNHVGTFVSHFKGMDQWTIVSEPYISPYRKRDVLYQKLGYEYIEIAYRAAREANPAATLIYEDTFNHTSNGMTTRLTHQIIDGLKAQELVDMVGLEMHIDASEPLDKDDIVRTMKSYGIPISITSLDVDLRSVPGSQQERFALQARIYAEILEAAFESGVCADYSVWGINDRYNWLDAQDPRADPTPYDDHLHPKPAFWYIMKVLSDHL